MTKKPVNSLQAILNRASAESDVTIPAALDAGVADEGSAKVRGRRAPAPASVAAPAARPAGNPGRAGLKLIGGHFPPETSVQLKILAAEEGTTVQALLEEAIADLLTKKAGRKVRR